MSTGYGSESESLRQVCATLLGERHVPERLCGGLVYLGRYNKCSPLPLPLPLSDIPTKMVYLSVDSCPRPKLYPLHHNRPSSSPG